MSTGLLDIGPQIADYFGSVGLLQEYWTIARVPDYLEFDSCKNMFVRVCVCVHQYRRSDRC